MNTLYHLNLPPPPLVVDYILSLATPSPLCKGATYTLMWLFDLQNLLLHRRMWSHPIVMVGHVTCPGHWEWIWLHHIWAKKVQNKFKTRLYLLFFSLCFENNMFRIGSAPSTWPHVKKIQKADPQKLNCSNWQVTYMRNCFVNHKHCDVCYHRKANALHTWCYSQSFISQEMNAIYSAHLSQGDLLKYINHIVLLPGLNSSMTACYTSNDFQSLYKGQRDPA